MRVTVWKAHGLLLGLAGSIGLAACATQSDGTTTAAETRAANTAAVAAPAPGVFPHSGAAIAEMSGQYSRPHPGPVATGASSWVPAAPAPAFVLSGPLPAAAPPAPPPAAVANRQPSAPAPGVPASDIVRPEAAVPATPAPTPAPAPAAAARNPAVRPAGLALFNQYSCNACHSLADAQATGSIGPSLDRNPTLTKDYAVEVISNGRGAMPSFAGQMSPEQIDQIAEYIVQFSRK